MHLMVGTPMYGGMCNSEYAQSMMDLREGLVKYNHKMTCVFIGNESLVQRARNVIAWHFLNSDASHLLFMDADQKFRANDLVAMINADKDIIGAPVPMKGINWDRVRQGAISDHPNLSLLTGFFNLNKLEGHDFINVNEPFQVKHIGTGFMLIKREVFQKMQQHVDYYFNRGSSIPPNERVYNFFNTEVINHEFLSEDFWFCDKYRKIGGTVWAAPWCQVGHFGSYLFNGQYAQEALYGSPVHQVSS